MRPFDYLTPTTVEEAIALLDGGEAAGKGSAGARRWRAAPTC